MPVAPIQPLVLEYTALNGEQSRSMEPRNPLVLPFHATDRIRDDLSLSEGALKLAAELPRGGIQQILGRSGPEPVIQSGPPVRQPTRRFDTTA